MTSPVCSKAVQRRADELIEKADLWAEGQDRNTGVRFVLFTSSRAPKAGETPRVYRTRFDGRVCDCPAVGVCCHRVAVATVYEQARALASIPRKKYEDLWVGDGSQLTDAF